MFRDLNVRYGGIRYSAVGRKRELFPSPKVYEAITRRYGASPQLTATDLLWAFESVAAFKGFNWQSLLCKWDNRWLQWFVDLDANLRWLTPDSDLRPLVYPYGDKTIVKGATNCLWLFESFLIGLHLPQQLNVFQVGHEGSVGWRWSADVECARWSANTNRMSSHLRLVVGEVKNTDIIYIRSIDATYAEMIIDPANVVQLATHDAHSLYPLLASDPAQKCARTVS